MFRLHSKILRGLINVPRPVRLLLVGGLIAQFSWRLNLPPPQATAEELPSAPSHETLLSISLGDPAVLSRLISLWLQAFDNQPGISIPFKELDYQKVVGWLDASLLLDHKNVYPMLAASNLYAEVPDSSRSRYMLAYVEKQFKQDPEKRWRWMANAVIIAKHKLRDLRLAAHLAEQLANQPKTVKMPGWARQMRIFVLEDLGEYAAAATLIGGLLEAGEISTEREALFLARRLETLKQILKSKGIPADLDEKPSGVETTTDN